MKRFISEKNTIVRKQHKCYLCASKINKSDKANIYTGANDDGIYKLYMHPECHEYTKSWRDDDWDNHMPGDISRAEVISMTANVK